MCASRLSLNKKSLEPYVYNAFWPLILSFPWLLPKSEKLWRSKLSSITGTITNVPGPKDDLYWAGVKVEQYGGYFRTL